MITRMEKYHNQKVQKNRKIKRGLATALMSSVLVAPLALSTSSAVKASSVAQNEVSNNQETVWKANSVEAVKGAMKDQGLDVNHVSGKYVVRQGDTLSAISQAANESMDKIATDNGITNLDLIYVGQVLYLNADGSNVVAQKGTATNPAVSSDALNVMNGSKLVGSGTEVAKPAHTEAEMQATSMVNSGVKPNQTAAKGDATTGNAGNTGSFNGAISNGNTNTGANTGSSVNDGSSATDNTGSSNTGATNGSATNESTGSTTPSTPNNGSNTGNSGSVNGGSDSQSGTTTPSNPDTGNSGSQTPSNPDSGNTGNTNPSTPDTGNTGNSGSQGGSTTPSNPDTGNSGSQTPSNPDSGNTGNQGGSSTETPSTPDYQKGVVNADGTTNYEAAKNQQGDWDNKDATPYDDWGNSEASDAWAAAHPDATMVTNQFADGNNYKTPAYTDEGTNEASQLSDEQAQTANEIMQQNINASDTFGNGIQWVSSDYNGEVVGQQSTSQTNPENAPWVDQGVQTGQVNANVVKDMYTNKGYTAPDGAKYVSSTTTSNGDWTNTVELTFYK